MEELFELRTHLVEQRYEEALDLLTEMEEMSRKSIQRNIRSYLVRLLVHLIKNQLEARLTNSWAASIRHSILEIQDLNVMGNKRSFYVKPDDWLVQLDEVLEDALYDASTEVHSGQYRPYELELMIDRDTLFQVANALLKDTHILDRSTLAQNINQMLQTLPGGGCWTQR